MGFWEWLVPVAGGVVVVIAALTGIFKAVKWMATLIREIREFLEDWRGEPARPEVGWPERKGVMQRLHELETNVKKVHHEVVPNGGGSLRDSVNRIETAVSTAVEEGAIR